MDVAALLRTRLYECLAGAKESVAAHRKLVQRAKDSTDEDERAALAADMNRLYLKWEQQMDKCSSLRQMLSDYIASGWERTREVQVR